MSFRFRSDTTPVLVPGSPPGCGSADRLANHIGPGRVASAGRPPVVQSLISRALISRALISRALISRALMSRALMSRALMSRALMPLALLIVLACGAGCAGYRFGNGTLYRPDVRTVHVPMFQSDALRRYWGELLTEAVIKEIELKTPYKVVHYPNADSTLSGRVVAIDKRVLVEDRLDLPRDTELEVAVLVEWRDRNGQPIGQPSQIPIPSYQFSLVQSANFVSEAGQSVATAELEAVQKLAEQIVSQMEMRW